MNSLFRLPPALENLSTKPRFIAVMALRALLLSMLVFTICSLTDVGTSPWLIAAGVVPGVIAGSRLAFGRLRLLGFAMVLVGGVIGYRALWWLINKLPVGGILGTLTLPSLELHINVAATGFAIALFTTWFFWRSKHALTVELLALILGGIYLLAGHRNLRLDQPELVNNIAWSLGWSPLTILASAGVVVVVTALGFVLLNSPAGRPQRLGSGPVEVRPTIVYRDSAWSVAGLVAGILIIGLFYLIAQITFWVFSGIASGSITAMGVGQETKEQLSPLGFHSSLGKNAQPAAVVRLEGDYSSNPFTPMLYFRESALSGFNGREMVIADARYDQDVNRSRPDEAYAVEPDLELLSRTPLEQSVFLLADHKTAFAIDYPLQIRQLQNPNPGRFKGSYKAYSVAPGFSIKDIAGLPAGDPRWDEATRKHYLVPHPDPRYAALAQKITAGVSEPVAQAFLITQWFSKNAIYTLTPQHDVAPDADPVAPFLFGDMRGYCVHFAHAMVYLFRSLGIPSRIGTGYLTDLSQARDGHILLRMNDRHAWSEVYVEGRGWLPFDPQPEQVENHGESPVDMKLLEELMGMLGPSEEILPKEVGKDESALAEPSTLPIPDWRLLGAPIFALVLLLILGKIIVRIAWLLVSHPSRRLSLQYRACEAILCDLGYRRRSGETREEYRARLHNHFSEDVLPLVPHLNAGRFGGVPFPAASPGEEALTTGNGVKHLRRVIRTKFSLWTRLRGVFNLSSGAALLMRRPW